MRRALSAWALLALSCAEPPRAATAASASGSLVRSPAASAAPLTIAPVTLSPTAEPTESSSAALLARLGATLHGTPLALPARSGRPAGQLVFVGTPEIAHAAWLLPPRGGEPLPVANWPAALRVLGGLTRQDALYVLVETRALLDQPAGVRAVLEVRLAPGAGAIAALPARWNELTGVADLADLARRLDAPAPALPLGSDISPACEILRAAARSPGSIASALPPQGIALVPLYQRILAGTPRARLNAAALATTPRASHLAEIVRDVIESGCCIGACTDPVDPTRGVALTLANGRPTLTAMLDQPFAPEGAARAVPRALPAEQPSAATIAFVRARFAAGARAMTEAPLGVGGGTIALVRLADNSPAVVLTEAGVPRVLEVGRGVPWAEAVPIDARFADLDGDGRTDLVMAVGPASTSRQGEESATFMVHAYLTPRSVHAPAMIDEPGSALALLEAPDLDAGVHAALALPWRGVDRDAACALVAQARSAVGFARAAAPSAKIYEFSEPAQPTYRATPAQRPGGVRIETTYRCGDLVCAPDRPYCRAYDPRSPGPASDWYWFTWEGARLRIAGVASYGGS